MENLWAKIPPDKIPSSTEIDESFWDYLRKGDKVLEVGCGQGRFLYSCSARGLEATGIDINKNAIDQLNNEAWFFGVNAYYADILTAKFEKKFNGAMLQGILCSLSKEDRVKCLNKVRAIMENGGYLHVAEFEMNDNFGKRYSEDFKITGEYGTLSIKDKDTGEELCRSHNFYEEEISELIKKAGFKIVSLKRTFFTSYHGEKKPGIMIIAKNN